MKKLIAFTLLFSIVLGSYTLPTSATTLEARDEETGNCIRKGNCRD